MKKMNALLLLVSFPILIFAQIERGSWEIAGGMNWDYSLNSGESRELTTSTSSIRINPQIGYFFSRNFSLGLHYNYGKTITKFANLDRETLVRVSDKGGGFWAKLYLGRSAIRPYFSFSGLYVKEKLFEDFDRPTTSTEIAKTFWLFSGLGLNVFLSENVAINGLVNFKLKRFGEGYLFDRNSNIYTHLGLNFFINQTQKTGEPIQINYIKKGNYIVTLESLGDTQFKKTPWRMSFASGIRYYVNEKAELGVSGEVFATNFIEDLRTDYRYGGSFHVRYFVPLSSFMVLAPKFQFGFKELRDQEWAFHPSGKTTIKQSQKQLTVMPELLVFFSKQNLLKFGIHLNRTFFKEKRNIFAGLEGFEQKDFSFGWQAGLEHFLNENISLELTGKWFLSNTNIVHDTDRFPNTRNYETNSGIRFGVNYFIRKKS